jgi:uncharacterized membrane protein
MTVIYVMEEVYLEEYLVRVVIVPLARLPYLLVRFKSCERRQVLSGSYVGVGSFWQLRWGWPFLLQLLVYFVVSSFVCHF